MNKIKVGIFFGGSSREREISFAGGRTVYDNLNKSIFEPVPIFVDSFHNLALIDWEFIYKGTIRDFYPPADALPKGRHDFQMYVESLGAEKAKELIHRIGQPIKIEDLKKLIDVAFLALHGSGGEDGRIQGLLEFLDIAYTGSGILPSAIGINKAVQKEWMKKSDFILPPSFVITPDEWSENPISVFEKAKKEITFPLVVRPANQGSSIGVSIIREAEFDTFTQSVNLAFFEQALDRNEWTALSEEEQIQKVQQLADIKEGLGLPVFLDSKKIIDPNDLMASIINGFESKEQLILKGSQSETEVLIEAFINGREFSCIVMRKEDGSSLALPPTEILKGNEVYDYRSKYLPGLSRKLTPIQLEESAIVKIQEECKRLFELFRFHTYARIDGFYTDEGEVILNDPNTTSGMMPSSFFFHQAAELGLNPSQFLSYILRISLQERKDEGVAVEACSQMIESIDRYLTNDHSQGTSKKRVAVIFGGYSSERHISVESGRNVFEKLSSSDKYHAIPVFLTGNADAYELYEIPINLVLKDNADDIKDKIAHFSIHPSVQSMRLANQELLDKYADKDVALAPRKLSISDLKDAVDLVFIALHGRPGEDGNLQAKLEQYGIPYNGSEPSSASTTIDKFKTLEILRNHGFVTAQQGLYSKAEYQNDPSEFKQKLLSNFDFPFVAKPVDDGCSSAVEIVRDEKTLDYYLEGIFRDNDHDATWRKGLDLKLNEEFPAKEQLLIESLIGPNGAEQFMEITGGLLTHRNDDGELRFEMFEPSEALSVGEVLSLEEKFLAGQGQNITPARFGTKQLSYEEISKVVKADLQKAAEILGVSGYARIDAFVRVYADGKIETVIIEINSLPGMTPATCIFHQCAINDYKPFEFIDGILTFAQESRVTNIAQ